MGDWEHVVVWVWVWIWVCFCVVRVWLRGNRIWDLVWGGCRVIGLCVDRWLDGWMVSCFVYGAFGVRVSGLGVGWDGKCIFYVCSM